MAQTLKHGLAYHDLLSALPRSGCPICRVRSDRLARFFVWFGIETYYAPEMVEQLTRAGGFCAIHARVFTRRTPRYVGAVVAQYVLEAARAEIEQHRANLTSGRGYRRRRIAQPRAGCPACVYAAEEDVALTREWVEALAVPEFRAQLATSDGLCLPHLRRVVDCAPFDGADDFLRTQIDQLERLEAELAEYFRKVDYRFATEPKGDEQTAWRRTWERLTGWPLDRLIDANDPD